MNNFIVYRHKAPNGKLYIGITSEKPERRWRRGEGYKGNKHFYRAIIKYGWDSIEHEILYSNLSEETAKKKEIELIEKYNTNNTKFGYNKTLGGDYRSKLSKESIQKLREKLIGQKRTEEQKVHYREGAKKRKRRDHLSEEHKRKISKSLIGNKRAAGNTWGRKMVYQYTKDWGLVAVFYSVKEAASKLKCDNSGICRACRENEKQELLNTTKYKGIYNGYKWSYSKV